MNLHVTVQGRGPDLVLLHGWALHGGVFDALAETLSPRYRIHAIDLPGHGHSDLPTDLHGIGAWVQAVAPYVPANAILLGWSLGGLVATYLAARLPLQALALISTTPKFVADAEWPHAMAPAVFAQFSQRLQQDLRGAVEDFLSLQVRGDSQAADTLAELKQRLLRHPPRESALHAGLDLLRDSDARAVLDALKLPVLVIAGEHDRITHPNASRYLAARLPQARLRIIRRAGHAPFISHREELVHELHSFLAEAVDA